MTVPHEIIGHRVNDRIWQVNQASEVSFALKRDAESAAQEAMRRQQIAMNATQEANAKHVVFETAKVDAVTKHSLANEAARSLQELEFRLDEAERAASTEQLLAEWEAERANKLLVSPVRHGLTAARDAITAQYLADCSWHEVRRAKSIAAFEQQQLRNARSQLPNLQQAAATAQQEADLRGWEASEARRMADLHIYEAHLAQYHANVMAEEASRARYHADCQAQEVDTAMFFAASHLQEQRSRAFAANHGAKFFRSKPVSFERAVTVRLNLPPPGANAPTPQGDMSFELFDPRR